ncbi:MAG TPA: NnrU family protein [Acetobacteraceae bacterium]|nr:NnrU family protein [Acetobacteraceae bacterium]
MKLLMLAALVWIAVHSGLAGTDLRSALVRRFGEARFRATFSLISLGTITFLIVAYARAPVIPVWFIPRGLHDFLLLVMLAAFILFAGAVTTRNLTSVGGEKAPPNPAEGMQRVTRHPMLWSFALWAGVHMIALGTEDGFLFFGAFLITAIWGMPSIDAKLAQSNPSLWTELSRTTSILPFGAIIAGRNRFAALEIGWIAPIAAFAVWIVFLVFLHRWLFGVSPLAG